MSPTSRCGFSSSYNGNWPFGGIWAKRYFESLMNNEDNFVNTGGNPYDLLLQSRVRGAVSTLNFNTKTVVEWKKRRGCNRKLSRFPGIIYVALIGNSILLVVIGACRSFMSCLRNQSQVISVNKRHLVYDLSAQAWFNELVLEEYCYFSLSPSLRLHHHHHSQVCGCTTYLTLPRRRPTSDCYTSTSSSSSIGGGPSDERIDKQTGKVTISLLHLNRPFVFITTNIIDQ